MTLSILTDIVQKILNLLSLLDSLVEGCAIEGALPQEQISEDLLEATQQQSQHSFQVKMKQLAMSGLLQSINCIISLLMHPLSQLKLI